jgi:hypothetical protein
MRGKNNSTKDSLTDNFAVVGPCCWQQCPARELATGLVRCFDRVVIGRKACWGDTQARPAENVPGQGDRNEPVSKSFLPVDRVLIIPSSTVMWP